VPLRCRALLVATGVARCRRASVGDLFSGDHYGQRIPITAERTESATRPRIFDGPPHDCWLGLKLEVARRDCPDEMRQLLFQRQGLCDHLTVELAELSKKVPVIR
jgi:hypothetical protein